MLGLGTSRFPRVSFKTERPFIIGTVVTFGLITWLHNKLYRNGKKSLRPRTGPLANQNSAYSQAYRHGQVLFFTWCSRSFVPLFRVDPDPFIFKDPSAASETAHH